MDIQKIITDLVGKLAADKNLTAKFKKDPVGTVKGLVNGMGVTDAQIKTIADGVMAKMGIEDAAGLLGKLGGMFK